MVPGEGVTCGMADKLICVVCLIRFGIISGVIVDVNLSLLVFWQILAVYLSKQAILPFFFWWWWGLLYFNLE